MLTELPSPMMMAFQTDVRRNVVHRSEMPSSLVYDISSKMRFVENVVTSKILPAKF